MAVGSLLVIFEQAKAIPIFFAWSSSALSHSFLVWKIPLLK